MRALEIVASFDRTIVGVWHLPIGKTKQEFTVGTERGAMLAVKDARLALDPHPIITIANDSYSFDGAEALIAHVEDDGKRRVLTLGEVTLEVREVDAPRRQVWRAPIDWIAARPSALCALVVAIFLALAFSTPPSPKSLVVDRIDNERIASIIMIARMLPPPPPSPKTGGDSPTTGSGTGGKRAPEPEGRRGNPLAQRAPKRELIRGSADHREYLRSEAYRAASQSGPLAILAQFKEGSHVGAIFGRDRILGSDGEDAMGQITGATGGDSFGDPTAGGTVGSRRGGGGDDEVGADVGACTGKHCDKLFGDGRKYVDGKHGPSGPGLKDHATRAPDVLCAKPGQCEPQLQGGLSREIVRRVVRQHLAEVKYCYEKRLQHHAGLDGRVTVQFTIAGSGKVAASTLQQSTLPDTEVGACIVSAVRTWDFPVAVSGSATQVSYPFMLRAAGE